MLNWNSRMISRPAWNYSLSIGMSIHFFALEAILEYLDDIESRHQAPSEGHGQSGMGEVAAPA